VWQQKPVLWTETRSYGRITAAAAADFTARGEVVIDNTVLRTIIYTNIPLLYTYIVYKYTCVRGKRKRMLNNNTESNLYRYERRLMHARCLSLLRCNNEIQHAMSYILLVLLIPMPRVIPGWVRLRYYIIIIYYMQCVI